LDGSLGQERWERASGEKRARQKALSGQRTRRKKKKRQHQGLWSRAWFTAPARIPQQTAQLRERAVEAAASKRDSSSGKASARPTIRKEEACRIPTSGEGGEFSALEKTDLQKQRYKNVKAGGGDSSLLKSSR